MDKSMTALLNALLDFAEDKKLIAAEDRAYTLNRLLEIVDMDAPEDAPLPLLQAYLESRLEKRIPPLLTPL